MTTKMSMSLHIKKTKEMNEENIKHACQVQVMHTLLEKQKTKK